MNNEAASKIAVTSSLRSFPSVPYLSRLICSPEAKRIRPARSAHKWDQQKIISPRRRRHCPPRRAPPTKIGTERSDADTNAHSYPDPDTYTYSYSNSYADSYTYSDSNSYADTHSNTYSHADSNSHANTNSYSISYTDSYASPDTDTYSYSGNFTD